MSAATLAEAARSEIKRQKRVVNQMRTMHSILRYRYQYWSRLLTVILVFLSVAGATIGFSAPADEVSILGIKALRTSWLGWFALVVILVVLVDQLLDLRARSVNHADAVRRLAALMSEYRSPVPLGEELPVQERLTRLYELVMEGLPDIPDRNFNSLKAAHLRKVEVSKFLSAHPGTSERRARRAVSKRLTH